MCSLELCRVHGARRPDRDLLKAWVNTGSLAGPTGDGLMRPTGRFWGDPVRGAVETWVSLSPPPLPSR